jgi:hypothetical protein
LARITASAAMMPLAPPLLSMITGWPHICVNLSARMRVLMSVEAPGGNGTTRVTRPVGKVVCALTPWEVIAAVANPAKAVRRPIRVVMSFLLRPLLYLARSMSRATLARHRSALSCAAHDAAWPAELTPSFLTLRALTLSDGRQSPVNGAARRNAA